jgi:hypothetical protein
VVKTFIDLNELKLSSKSIYKTIFLQGSMTKKDIIAKIGGSLSSVSRFTSELAEGGLIVPE